MYVQGVAIGFLQIEVYEPISDHYRDKVMKQIVGIFNIIQ